MQSRNPHIRTVALVAMTLAAPNLALANAFHFPSPAGHFEGQPAFSPDGRFAAAFVRGAIGGGNGLRLLSTATWESMGIGDAPSQLSWRSKLSFSPDGRHLMVNAGAGTEFSDLWVMEIESRKWTRLTGSDRAPGRWGLGKWSPDGTQLLAGGKGRPWTVWDARGGVRPIELAAWPADAVKDIAWSSDGASLWVGVDMDSAPPATGGATDTQPATQPVSGLYRVSLSDLASELVVPLSSVRAVHASPKGGLVACVTRGSRLVLVDSADQSAVSAGEYSGDLTWTTDGLRLAFRSPRGPVLYDAAARRRVRLPAGAETIFFSAGGNVWGAGGSQLLELSGAKWRTRFRLGATAGARLTVRDLNNDRRIDALDYLVFQMCFNGSGRPAHPDCPAGVNVDYDADGDVDLADFAIFERHINPRDFARHDGKIVTH